MLKVELTVFVMVHIYRGISTTGGVYSVPFVDINGRTKLLMKPGKLTQVTVRQLSQR